MHERSASGATLRALGSRTGGMVVTKDGRTPAGEADG
jgi:hypothetical protein